MFRHTLSFDTNAKAQIRTITPELSACIVRSGIRNGTLLVYSLHTTLGLILQETGEPNLCQDFLDFLNGFVEDDGTKYHHACALHPSGTCEEDRYNAPSHVRQLVTNQSLMLDIHNGCLTLGRWQDVALLELDGPRRERQVFLKIVPDGDER